jgi:predicted RNA-binding protein with RPS1 domain
MMIDENKTPENEGQDENRPAGEASQTTTMDQPEGQSADQPTQEFGAPPTADQPIAEQAEAAGEQRPDDVQPSDETAALTTAYEQVTPEQEQRADEPAPQAEAPQTPTTPDPGESDRSDDMMLFEAAMTAMETGEDIGAAEGSYRKLSRGERLEATVIQVDRDRVFVDLGTKSEGIVPLGELGEGNVEHASEHVKVGDRINVVVIRPEGAEGNPIVSKKRADFEETWDRIEQAFQEGSFIKAQVVDRVKGGLVVDVGVRGFVPATHVGSGKLRNIEKFVGQPLRLKVIEIDRERKKVVLSNRQAEEEEREKAKEEIFENVKPGDEMEGTVRRLTDYGAFVDLGGVDGLLHISEMSWMRINHPREMFKEGQKIKVMVLRLDPEKGKISLGHRQVLPDPWNLIKENYKVGQKFTCKISRLVQNGAFIKLPEGAEAFLPLSEMSNRRARRPEEVVEENQEVEVQVLDLRTDERRMVLSMRAAGAGDMTRTPQEPSGGYDDDFDRRKLGPKKKGKKAGGRRGREDEDVEETIGRRGFATGGATIGERLGMLRGFLRPEEDEEEELTGEAEAAGAGETEASAPGETEAAGTGGAEAAGATEETAPEPEAATPTPEPEAQADAGEAPETAAPEEEQNQ